MLYGRPESTEFIVSTVDLEGIKKNEMGSLALVVIILWSPAQMQIIYLTANKLKSWDKDKYFVHKCHLISKKSTM